MKRASAQDLSAEKDPICLPPTLHNGQLIPSDFLQCICLNKIYAAARYDPEAAKCLRANGLPTPQRMKHTRALSNIMLLLQLKRLIKQRNRNRPNRHQVARNRAERVKRTSKTTTGRRRLRSP